MSKFDTKLDNDVNKLTRERAPERDLWPGIALGIYQGHRKAEVMPFRRFSPAIAAGLVVTVLVLYLSQIMPQQEKGGPVKTGQALVQSMSQQHEQQKNVLLTRFGEQVALTDDWQQQLSELDEAAQAVKQALAEDPDNTALIAMLQHIYQQQLLLIERVHAPKWQQI